MNAIPSYARSLFTPPPALTLLPPAPKPPTPPTTRKRKPAPDFAPRWAVGSRIAVRDYEKFGGVTTTVFIQQVIIQLPHEDKRRFRITEPTALYVAVYRDGTTLIANEGALSAMAGYALKTENARPMQATSVLNTSRTATTATNHNAA